MPKGWPVPVFRTSTIHGFPRQLLIPFSMVQPVIHSMIRMDYNNINVHDNYLENRVSLNLS